MSTSRRRLHFRVAGSDLQTTAIACACSVTGRQARWLKRWRSFPYSQANRKLGFCLSALTFSAAQLRTAFPASHVRGVTKKGSSSPRQQRPLQEHTSHVSSLTQQRAPTLGPTSRSFKMFGHAKARLSVASQTAKTYLHVGQNQRRDYAHVSNGVQQPPTNRGMTGVRPPCPFLLFLLPRICKQRRQKALRLTIILLGVSPETRFHLR